MKILKERENFNEIIFENRNKEYGAYFLRKKYNGYVTRGLLIAVVIGSLIVGIPFLVVKNKSEEMRVGSRGRVVQLRMDKLEPPEEQIIIPPAAPPPPPAAQEVVKYVAPVVVDTVLPAEKLVPIVDEVLASPETETEEIAVFSDSGQDELFGDNIGEGGDEPFVLVEVPPSFRGGDLDNFRAWIQKRVIYPQAAQENGVQGKVFLTFIVERDGSVSNVNVLKSVDKLLDDEAKRAIESSPKWSPGLQRGRPVRVRFSIYLNFAL